MRTSCDERIGLNRWSVQCDPAGVTRYSLFPLPTDMCLTMTLEKQTGHRRPRSSACEFGNFFPPCSAKSWSVHSNVGPHLYTTYQRHEDMIDQFIKENYAKRTRGHTLNLGTVRGNREATKWTFIIHDFMYWQNEIKYNQTTWNYCCVMQRLWKSQLLFMQFST